MSIRYDMYRRGHVGIVLLCLAPVLYALVRSGRPFLAVLACGVLVIEPLPDYDHRVSFLEHRGVSHSLIAVAFVGGFCGALGGLVGTYVTAPFGEWLHTTFIQSDNTAFAWIVARLAALNARMLAAVGFSVGGGGIVLHLFGDIITVAGIQPWLPFSNRTVSLSSLYAKNKIANGGLFVLGVVAMGVAALAVTPLGTIIWSAVGSFLGFS